jgi:hypothetical protein
MMSTATTAARSNGVRIGVGVVGAAALAIGGAFVGAGVVWNRAGERETSLLVESMDNSKVWSERARDGMLQAASHGLSTGEMRERAAWVYALDLERRLAACAGVAAVVPGGAHETPAPVAQSRIDAIASDYERLRDDLRSRMR